MDPIEALLSAGTLATLILELAKYAIRRIFGDAEYDFPPIFYNVAVPLVVFLSQIAIGYANFGPMPEFTVAYLVQWALGVVATLAVYFLTLKPAKLYRTTYAAAKAAKARVRSNF